MAAWNSACTEEQDLFLESAHPPASFPSPPAAAAYQRLAPRLAAGGVVLGVFVLIGKTGLAVSAPGRPGSNTLTSFGADSVEQKFYGSGGVYWQAPKRAISTSEFWGDCSGSGSHLHTCDGYCCCDEDFYWKSPKSIYGQMRSILRAAAMKTAGKESKELSATSAVSAVQDSAVAVGKAALTSLVSKDQGCVPKADVPDDVVKALHNEDVIPGSDMWATCGAFTSNTHSCGNHCCCNGGFEWSATEKECSVVAK